MSNIDLFVWTMENDDDENIIDDDVVDFDDFESPSFVTSSGGGRIGDASTTPMRRDDDDIDDIVRRRRRRRRWRDSSSVASTMRCAHARTNIRRRRTGDVTTGDEPTTTPAIAFVEFVALLALVTNVVAAWWRKNDRMPPAHRPCE
jgi:hypothetical protein